MSFRSENDFLGEKQIPEEAYWGVQTARAIENFPITGYKLDEALIRAMALVKKSAALANTETGRMKPEVGQAIAKACDEIIEGQWRDQFVVDPIQGGAGTSINMNTNEVVANRALELMGKAKGSYEFVSPNDDVNMAQSTNDAFPTAIHLSALFRLKELLAALEALCETFGKKAKEFEAVIKMGRTHLQDAVPIRLGQEFAAYQRVLKRDLARIGQASKALLHINMGATAVGTGLNADPNYIRLVAKKLAEFSGFPFETAEDLVDGTQNTDGYIEVSAALKVCMLNISKVCNDLRMMASGPRCGLGELNLPARQPGSSIMPGKVNPVIAEVVNQVAFKVVGNDLTISMASEAGQFELNVMEPVMVFSLLESIKMMAQAFTVFRTHLLEGVQANAERMKAYVDNSAGIVTALNPHIGYKASSKVVREAVETGKPVREIILRDKLLSPEDLEVILDPMEMTSPGIAGARLLKK
ncbi:MAG: aspartate ammonia-lyase [Cystobacterineae bacterium]|nr:aspartate ammonia-lyase [Cystobacterineae bacterium]